MPDTRDLADQIMDEIADELGGISGLTVDFPTSKPPSAFGTDECPAVQLRRASKNSRQHLRGAEEFILEVDVVCIAANKSSLGTLIADVKDVSEDNRTWDNLARRTRVVEDDEHETETEEVPLTGIVTLFILARADRKNPAAVKAI